MAGKGCCGQGAKIEQGSLASEAPSESTLAFISPRLVTAPHECHLSVSGLCGGLTDGGIVSCRYAPAVVSLLPQNLFAAPQFGLFTSRLIA